MTGASMTAAPALDLSVWADLSKAATLAKRFEGDSQAALAAARMAIGSRNVAVRRNALRVVESAFLHEAPLRDNHPAIVLLEGASRDVRPLVMWEARGSARVLQGQERHDLDTAYDGVTFDAHSEQGLYGIVWRGGNPKARLDENKVARYCYGITRVEFAGIATLSAQMVKRLERGDLSKSLGQRTLAMIATHFGDNPDFTGRRWWKLPRASRTPYETCASDLNRVGALHVYATSAELLQGTRRSVLEKYSRLLPSGDFEKHDPAFQSIQYTEDPAAADIVIRALVSPKDSVRRKAILTAGLLGDPSVIAIAERALADRTRDLESAAKALALLGDIRGYDLLWRIIDAGKVQDQALSAIPLFGEVAADAFGRLAARPALLSREGARVALCESGAISGLDALMHVVEMAHPFDPQDKALAGFALSKKRLGELSRTGHVMITAGLVQSPAGPWIWDPAKPTPNPTKAEAAKGEYWWKDKERWDRLFGTENISLTWKSDLSDWTGELIRLFEARVRDERTGPEERALSLLRLAQVSSERRQLFVDRALDGVAPASAALLRSHLPPEKPRKKGGPIAP